ncbi:MAG: GNAT family N-acetyltransferase [Akkermansiaceae bacterium]|nr:GNAT family N-acetyltransferase [Armatimonadota bacterium]
MNGAVSIVPYQDKYRTDFDRLNRAWVSRHFLVEPGDEKEFGDPYGHFVAPGGQVLFLISDSGGVLGTVALAKHADLFEVAKMTVDEAHRGKGYGKVLMEAAIDYATDAGGSALELVSNTRLETAIGMYRKHGFVEVPLGGSEEYSRANIRMRREL